VDDNTTQNVRGRQQRRQFASKSEQKRIEHQLRERSPQPYKRHKIEDLDGLGAVDIDEVWFDD
jgi:hypothetical protein